MKLLVLVSGRLSQARCAPTEFDMFYLSNYSHFVWNMAIYKVANYGFLCFAKKTFALGVAEFQRVICARFGGVSTKFTATIAKRDKSFLRAFFKKSEKSFHISYLLKTKYSSTTAPRIIR